MNKTIQDKLDAASIVVADGKGGFYAMLHKSDVEALVESLTNRKEENPQREVYEYVGDGPNPHDMSDILNYAPKKEETPSDDLVKVKSIESELIALQSFILTHLPSGIAEDYDFPSSTSRATVKRVMGIIRDSNEKFMTRVNHSISIRNAQSK